MKNAVIVLPTYNEKDNIEKIIREVFSQEKNCPGWQFQVLVSDSHSPDGTFELAKKIASENPKVHVISVGRGLGVGLIEGHKYAIKRLKPDALLQLDADCQVETSVIPKMLKVLEDGYDFAIGSRFVKGGKNKLSPMRRLFSSGASILCRILMGPWNIGEFTNSARAFTPELFKKLNFERMPWKEKTYIVEPAFLHECILAGAKYKEVPLIFKDRAEGYSKNKVFNYTYDVITYSIDARLRAWGISNSFFHFSRRIKTLVKFGLVGFSGTAVDFIFYNIFISAIGISPATAKAFSTEIAILNNFTWNNFWTFRYRKTKHSLFKKLAIFNLVSLGGLSISVLIVKFLHTLYGDGTADVMGLKIAYYNLYFFATIPPVMTWNFTINHLWTWRHVES